MEAQVAPKEERIPDRDFDTMSRNKATSTGVVVALGLLALLGAISCGAQVRPAVPIRKGEPWIERQEDHFILRYKAVDAATAPLVRAKLVKGCRTIETFFGAPFRRRFTVYLMPNREELTAFWRKLWGKPSFRSQCWMVANGRENLVAVLSPRVWPTEACEHDARNEAHIQNLLTHELTHTYHDQYNPRLAFDRMDPLAWFVEGLATYVAGQLEEGHQLPASDAIAKGLAPEKLADAHQGRYRYGVSGSLVKFLDVRFGRKLLRKMLPVVDQAEALVLIGKTEGDLLRDWRAYVMAAHLQAKPLKLGFVIDKEYDRTRIIGMFRHNDPAGLESRARGMGLPLAVARHIQQAKNPAEYEGALKKIVGERFQQVGGRLKAAKDEYTDLWRDLHSVFNQVVMELTEHPWFYDRYQCVVSAFHPGLSDWYGNKIAAKYDLRPELKRRIVAHEIVLSHVFHIMRKYVSKEKLDDWKVWAFSEISAVFVLGDRRLHRFWPKMAPAGSYFAKSNYPQLRELEQKLKARFDSRKSFRDYLDKAVGVLSQFSRTHRQ